MHQSHSRCSMDEARIDWCGLTVFQRSTQRKALAKQKNKNKWMMWIRSGITKTICSYKLYRIKVLNRVITLRMGEGEEWVEEVDSEKKNLSVKHCLK